MFSSENSIVITFLAVLAVIFYVGYRYNQKTRQGRKVNNNTDATGYLPLDSSDLHNQSSHQHQAHEADSGHHSVDHFHDSSGIDSSATDHGGFDGGGFDGGGDGGGDN